MPGPQHLIDLASARGVVTIADLDAAGFTEAQRRTAAARGLLVKAGVHTFRAGLVTPTALDELAFLLADCGPSAWASGPTAAAVLGYDRFELQRPFHVTVLRGHRNVRRPGAVIHSAFELPPIDRTIVDGIAVTSGVRTVIDLGRYCTVAELTLAIDSMIRDRRGTERALQRRIVGLRGPGRHGIRRVVAALEGADVRRGGASYLEREFLALIAKAGLPRPRTQAELGRDEVIRVDCRWPDTPVVVELLGYRWHRTARQMDTDTRRQNALVLAGFVVLAFTYRDVIERPDHVVATTAKALAQTRTA